MTATRAALRTEAARFGRFCGVGGIGFIADAGLLFCLTMYLALDPYLARVLSILVALTVTWGLHRRWTFKSRRAGRLAEWTRFALVNGGGGTVNYLVYALVLLLLPAAGPILALIAGSAVALLVNYLGSRFWAFRSRGAAAAQAAGR